MDSLLKEIDGKEVSMGEGISAFCNASARGLAKLAAIMANKGTQFGKTILSEKGFTEMHAEPILKAELDGGMITNYTKGGCNLHIDLKGTNTELPQHSFTMPLIRDLAYDYMGNRVGYYGWYGMGGSIFMWNPEYKIGFAYVPTDLMALDLGNVRNSNIQKKVVEIVKGS